MKPIKISHDPQGDLFKTELIRIVNLSHPLVRLGTEVNWERLDEEFGKTYDDTNGRPGSDTLLPYKGNGAK